MKKLITAGALIAVLASPAFAQTNHKRIHVNPQANAAQADTDNGLEGGPHGEIVWGSKVKGQDPDPFIRGSIVRGLGNYGGN
jgi:hypothetical protein